MTVEFAKQAQQFGSLVGWLVGSFVRSFVRSFVACLTRFSRKSAGGYRAVLTEPTAKRVLSLLQWMRRALHL